MFDAWAHEQGLDNITRAQYTPQELSRLQLGYLRREHSDGGSHRRSAGGGLSAREYDARQSRQDWLKEIQKN